MKQLQIYDFSMAAGGSFQLPVSGTYFRILTTVGNVSVTGDTFGKLGPISRGQGLEDSLYNRLTIRDESGAPNSGTILVSDANFIDQTLYGSISLAGAVDISVASQNAIRRPEPASGFLVDLSTIAANTAITFFTPAANVSGAILLSATSSDNAANNTQAFIAHTSAPANISTGEILALATNVSSTLNVCSINLKNPIFIPAGKGLYFLGSTLGAAGYARAARWRLL